MTALIWIAFFTSGVTGLAYELVWVRMLGQLFGATTPAVAATVSIFLGGLALGAHLGSLFFDRRRHPLRIYALLELAIGATAAAVPWLFELVSLLLGGRSTADSTVAVLVGSALVLIVPSTLIGATFPAMAAVLRSHSTPTQRTGYFYGVNTLGAVVGCLVASIWWIPALGLHWSTYTGVSLNVLAACLAWAVHLSGQRAGSSAAATGVATDADSAPAPEAPAAQASLPGWLAATLAVTSGFLAIAIEVMWVRAWSLSFPVTVYVFALVLAAFLVGIGLGSLALGRTHRRRAPDPGTLAVLYLLVAFGSLATQALIPLLMPWSISMFTDGVIQSWGMYVAWVGTVSVLLMLPATLAMGAALPLLIGVSSGGAGASRTAGRLYSLNTVAGLVASLSATFWLMPWLGLSRGLTICALGYLVLALVVLFRRPGRRRLRAAVVGLTLLLVPVLLLDLQPEVNPMRQLRGHKLLYYRDAPSATVSIHEDRAGIRSLRSNNLYSLAETRPATIAMQYRLGHLPLLLHRQPKRALLVGFATGSTLAAMSADARLKQLDCVEVNGLLFRLAPYFEAVNQRVWTDPRVRLFKGDGRRFLSRAGQRYDVIVADLFLPRSPGVGALYSQEHFAAVARRLQPGGVFVTWLPLWQLSPDETATIIRTFREVFPDAVGRLANRSPDRPVLGLVNTGCTSGPQDPARLERLLRQRVGASLARAFPALPGLQAPPPGAADRMVLGPRMLAAWSRDARINELARPVIEYSAPRTIMRARLEGVSLASRNLKMVARLWQGAGDEPLCSQPPGPLGVNYP